jgi:hypothetical protein
MTQGSATTTDICHPPGDGVDSCTSVGTQTRRIQDLRRTRDLVLERLLSGQVNLKEN